MRPKQPVFTWDDEPDERPSEFMPSTGYASLSGPPPELMPRRRSGLGFKSVIVAFVLFLGASGYVLYELKDLLRV